MALKALCRLGSWNQSEGEKSEIGGVRLYPSCPDLPHHRVHNRPCDQLGWLPSTAASIASAMRHPKGFMHFRGTRRGPQSVVHFHQFPFKWRAAA